MLFIYAAIMLPWGPLLEVLVDEVCRRDYLTDKAHKELQLHSPELAQVCSCEDLNHLKNSHDNTQEERAYKEQD